MRKFALGLAISMTFMFSLVAGAWERNSGASPERCGTPFQAPGQVCPPTAEPTPEPEPTPTERSRFR